MDYAKYIFDLAWELKLNHDMSQESINERLTNLFLLAKNAGKMERNGTNDIKIDTVNPFNY